MSKVLVIKAHPLTGEVSRSMQVVDTFITAYKEKNHFDHINEINLYTSFIPEIDLDILANFGMHYVQVLNLKRCLKNNKIKFHVLMNLLNYS